MADINLLAVLAAAIASFVIGGLWYSPMLFGKAWCTDAGVDMEKGHPPKVFVISLVFSLVAAYAFAVWIGPAPEMTEAIRSGVWVGVGFVAASFGINYQFASRPLRMWLIDSGYHVVQFVAFGVVLGLWH